MEKRLDLEEDAHKLRSLLISLIMPIESDGYHQRSGTTKKTRLSAAVPQMERILWQHKMEDQQERSGDKKSKSSVPQAG